MKDEEGTPLPNATVFSDPLKIAEQAAAKNITVKMLRDVLGALDRMFEMTNYLGPVRDGVASALNEVGRKVAALDELENQKNYPERTERRKRRHGVFTSRAAGIANDMVQMGLVSGKSPEAAVDETAKRLLEAFPQLAKKKPKAPKKQAREVRRG